MVNPKNISENLSASGQITPEDIQQLSLEGFKAIVNLRSSSEEGFLSDEQQQAEAVGLEYANIPLNPKEANQQLIQEAIQTIENLPKPILIHCAAGARASGIALIADAIQAGLTYEQIAQKANELGISLEQPHLKQFLLEKYTVKEK
jgi:uncharacterized protein (TIGR01244 family)